MPLEWTYMAKHRECAAVRAMFEYLVMTGWCRQSGALTPVWQGFWPSGDCSAVSCTKRKPQSGGAQCALVHAPGPCDHRAQLS